MYISDYVLESFIKEDVPYIDLTTYVMGIGGENGRITFTTREETVLSCVEEVIRIFEKLNIETKNFFPSGTYLEANKLFLEAVGKAADLHMAWKISLNIFEYCCGIATRTKRLVDNAKNVNPDISVVTTRKSFPGTKELTIKSILSGGAYPHRLGLSETIMIFKQHMNFIGGFDKLPDIIKKIRINACEKKIIVEVENEADAINLVKLGIDGLQFDKIPAKELGGIVEKIRNINPSITLIAAGGINEMNAGEYAKTGVNALATTSVYFGKPSDIKVNQVRYCAKADRN